MDRVKDKVIIITGGASGIGKAASILLAKHQGIIAVTDINEENGIQVVDEINQMGGRATFWLMNTAIENQVKKTIAAIHQQFGKIDVLVNNAGITGVNKPTHLLTENEWDEVMTTNVKGTFFCTKHCLPFLIKNKGGSIINISSIDGIIGEPDFPPYHASKGAVRLMTKTDALIYAKYKIRVNSIHPGYIWTPLMDKQAHNHPGGLQDFFNLANELHPIGHIGEPNDIAFGILYLASDESKFMTGSELIIDGGYTAQ